MRSLLLPGLCVLLCACASDPAIGSAPPPATLPDDGLVRPQGEGPVSMRVGQVLEIAQMANASTGYEWEFTSDGAPVLARTTGPATPPPMDTQPPMPGRPALARWWFRAEQPGEATVRMVYRRPWETVPPVEVVEYRIRVQGR
ncbi:protease inhibitor I42 family protein [Pseudoxanthomonas sp.]|jgi:inhibitor of cysteine peptidase|uniref:protease inhibitor I42 family protein n=1 Tax=Pseudoxanthomonas sp. TaxID=1871049 RepID=UPI002E115F87|nr:protease inhibitor I42 family protein [Pseudoxanthomonas sp.]